MSECFILYAPICSFMLTVIVVLLSIYGMLDRRIILVRPYDTIQLSKHLVGVLCTYYNELEIHDGYFVTYKRIPTDDKVPCIRDSCGNMDIFSIKGIMVYGTLLGAVSLVEFVLAFVDTTNAPIYVICSLLTFFSTALLVYTFAVKYKHASFAYGYPDGEKHRFACTYHNRSYYHKWWFLPVQIMLLSLFALSVFDMYYDPDYTAINSAYVEYTDVVCSDLVPNAIKYNQLAEVRIDQGANSFNTGLTVSASSFETLREQFVTASILQKWAYNAMLRMIISISYIILYIFLLFPMNYVLYLRSRFKVSHTALWFR